MKTQINPIPTGFLGAPENSVTFDLHLVLQQNVACV